MPILDVQIEAWKTNKCWKDTKLNLLYLFIWVAAEELDAAGCKLLSCWLAMLRLLEPPPAGMGTEDADEEAEGISCFEVVVVVAVVVPATGSTGFLERWRPLFMCRSQYFWSGTASLQHRHFFPSVLRHLPGSGSVLLENPKWIGPHPTAHMHTPKNEKLRMQERNEEIKTPILVSDAEIWLVD